MPQRFGLYEDLSVLENLFLYAKLKNVSPDDRDSKISELMELTGLSPFLHRLAGQLSGGMKQKLGLACALVSTPKLLLLDEPGVGVDPISRQELWDLTNRLAKTGITVVWSSAYLDEAARCEKVLLLNEGRVIYDGVPAALTDRLKNRTYRAQAVGLDKRQLLRQLKKVPEIIDVRLRGKYVLFLLEKETDLSARNVAMEWDIQKLVLQRVPPTFEDAFMAMVTKQKGKGQSIAATTIQTPTVNTEDLAIDAVSLTKKFGNFTAADKVSFQVKSGEIFGLLGPNGAGKSTTFKMLCGLLKPTSGSARVAGLDLTKVPSNVRARIGYMAQKFALYGDLSVEQNLDIFARMYGLGRVAREEAIGHVVSLLGLQPHMKSKGIDLSLGFQRRLSLAASIMHKPAILFLDEPTSGVDPITRREFWTNINLMAAQGVSIIVTTHFLDEAEYCDRIALINKGQVIASGAPDTLKERAATDTNTDPTLEDAFVSIISDRKELVL
jgi:ABC-2 type transport system ATP-binding protein